MEALAELDEAAVLEKFETAGKTSEEIERLSLREDLTEVERVSVLLQSSHPLQRLCGITSLPTVAAEATSQQLSDLLTKACNLAGGPKATRDLLFATAESLAVLLGRGSAVVSQQFASDVVMPLVMKSIKMAGDGELLSAWGAVFSALLSALPQESLRSVDVLGFLAAMGDPQNASPVRLLCCSSIEAMAKSVPALAAGLVEKALSMSQDVDFEVRAAMAPALEALSRALGPSAAKKVVLPAVLELLEDDASAVRQRSFEVAVALLPMFDLQTLDHSVVPALRKFCRDPADDVAPVVASLLGPLLVGVHKVLASTELQSFFQLYRGLAARKTADIRRSCAVNMPAMVSILGAERFLAEMKQTFLALASDPAPSVRRSIAAGFHEVVRTLGRQHGLHVRDAFFRLLQDSAEVVDPMIDNLHVTVALFECDSVSFQSTLFSAIMECNERLTSSRDWRLHERLLREIQGLYVDMPTTQVQDKLVPLLLEIMASNHVIPVKEAAIATLAIIVYRGVKTFPRRKDICEKIKLDFGRGSSYWKRLLFLTFVEAIAQQVSRRLFKDLFWQQALDLSQDKVALVRTRVCLSMPLLKAMIVLPGEAQLLKKLNSAAMRLKNDDDSGVAQAAVDASDKLNQVECSVEKFPTESDMKDLNKELQEEEMFDRELAEVEAAKHREEAERADVWRRMAEREAEISQKAKIYGKLPKSRLGRIKLPTEAEVKFPTASKIPSHPLPPSATSSTGPPKRLPTKLSATKGTSASAPASTSAASHGTRMPPVPEPQTGGRTPKSQRQIPGATNTYVERVVTWGGGPRRHTSPPGSLTISSSSSGSPRSAAQTLSANSAPPTPSNKKVRPPPPRPR